MSWNGVPETAQQSRNKYSISKHRYNNELTHLPRYIYQTDSSGANCSQLSADSKFSDTSDHEGAWKTWP